MPAEFHLLRPFWLLALLPSLLLVWLLYKYQSSQGLWHQLIARHLQPIVLLTQQVRRQQPWALPLLALVWVLSVLALSGPSWQKLPQPALTIKHASVIIMDMSMSMRATDLVPDRLTQQRFKALDLVDAIKEGDLALIAFAGEAFLISPLTPDHNNLRLQIPNLTPELMPTQGSNIEDALRLASELLQQAGYTSGDIILFTDGFEPTRFVPLQQQISRLPYRLSILAFGQQEGAVVRLVNGELLRNNQGAVVLPRVPIEQLAILARQGGGILLNAAADNRDIEQLAALITPSETAHFSDQQFGDSWHDAGIYLVWLLIPLAILLGRRTALFALIFFMWLPPAEAFSWRDLWQTRQQQANAAYQDGDFITAQQQFSDPFWQGNAAFQAGDYASATIAFEQALKQSPSADAFHNLGNALAMQQQFDKALEAYKQVLARRPDDERAQANAALMEQLLQQQAEQESQSAANNPNDENQDASSGEQSNQNSQDNSHSSDEDQSGDRSQPNNTANEQASDQQGSEEETAEATENPQESIAEQNADETGADADIEQQAAVQETWPNATPEQQQELENLLRKVQDDPGLLLRNRMRLEQQRRRHSAPPQGANQEW